MKAYTIIAILLFSSFLTIPAFADHQSNHISPNSHIEDSIEDSIREGVTDLVTEGIDGVYDGVMDEVDIPKNDFVNPTDEELEELKDDGKKWLEILFELFGQTHHVAESGVYVVSDYDLDPWIVSLIGLAVVAVVGIPMMKKLGMDLIKIVLLSVSLVAIIAVVGLVF